MGGCRCCFRNCHVKSSKYPRMHFFRFPLKEAERFTKWMQYSKMEHMVQFTEVRKKNTSICARHFRPECFMNYKMERLAPKAVPTLMRLSKDQALDFELDIENGILITMEETKLKHLIPPDDFESPLYLDYDKVLIEMLTAVREQQNTITIVQEGKSMESTKPSKSPTVEILETIQVSGPTCKRNSEYVIDEIQDVTIPKKFKILNSAHCSAEQEDKNETTIVLTPIPEQNDIHDVFISDIEIVDIDNVQHQDELVNDPNEILLTASECNNNSSGDDDDENIEFFELQKDDNDMLHDTTTRDSDTTIVQLKADNFSSTNSMNERIITLQNEISNLKKQNKDIESFQTKITFLENENSDLRKYRKESQDFRKKILALEMENNRIKTMLKEYTAVKEELKELRKEKSKLEDEVLSIPLLKSELLSRQKESKELKAIVQMIKNSKSDEKERVDNSTNEVKLKKQISTLQKQIDIKEQQLSEAKSQVEKIESDLKNMTKENENLVRHKNGVEEEFKNLQTSFAAMRADYQTIKLDYDNLQQKYSDLENKYLKIQALQNQESTVSTSFEKNKFKTNAAATVTLPAPTKAQLFIGIKRYLSASMVSLLRMEMFGSSEREWKPDERQVAVDILRLGETVYKYFTDEWRFRLPALRDVNNWLHQSLQMDNEEDL